MPLRRIAPYGLYRPSIGYAGSLKPGVEGWPVATRLSASASSSAVHL